MGAKNVLDRLPGDFLLAVQKVAVEPLVELLAALDGERVRYGLAREVAEDPRCRVQPEYRRQRACSRMRYEEVRNCEKAREEWERTEHREDPHAEIIEHAKLLHVALLELLFRKREKLDIARNLCGIHDGDA